MFEVIDSKFIHLESIYEESVLVLIMKLRNYSANQYKEVKIFKLSKGEIHLFFLSTYSVIHFVHSFDKN